MRGRARCFFPSRARYHVCATQYAASVKICTRFRNSGSPGGVVRLQSWISGCLGGHPMKKALSACLFSAVLLFPFAANAQTGAPLVRFDGGIGATPLRVNQGVTVSNIVRGVSPGGAPWVISR